MKATLTAFLAITVLLSMAPFAFAQTAASGTAQAPVTSAESPEIRELQKVENSWSNALNQRDQYGLELVLSPLFVDVAATGDVTTRNQQVVALINQADKTTTMEYHVITVRMLGDVAVANGTYTYTHHPNNVTVEEKGIFTHVFQKVHGNWVCLNAQRTPIRQDVPSKAVKAKAKPKSDAELPFHIPLFTKDKADKTNP